MSAAERKVTQVPIDSFGKGTEIIPRIYDRKGSGGDWALVELTCSVVGQAKVKM
ncbi:MAG: hypothetical protein GTO45_30540 [Candidatus Aminicenantes bacterium]|nr:hypothetical protein [Candidatus Aminicenantes bacterium]NIM83131.1 hypothetical protein [Candidatus Aminicenantes bacterium]NIN22511.1 hypothetical protein [Candidatus Aminicenantes bacterium]NIN46279.1 hypothetical protein [Candidatus Aminicenantes bacterium]NIN89117.1 hypothetical protein [Candidatus Aminicenantes bacterium]